MEIKLSIFNNLLNFPKMNLKAIQECERKGANRLMNFKLPSMEALWMDRVCYFVHHTIEHKIF